MARVERTKVVDLGTLAANEASESIDMRSFTHAVVFVESPSNLSSTHIEIKVEFSPQPYNSSPDWFELYAPANFLTSPTMTKNSLVLDTQYPDGTLYDFNRAYPIMPLDMFGFHENYETSYGEYLLPAQMRLTPASAAGYALTMKVMLAREID